MVIKKYQKKVDLELLRVRNNESRMSYILQTVKNKTNLNNLNK